MRQPSPTTPATSAVLVVDPSNADGERLIASLEAGLAEACLCQQVNRLEDLAPMLHARHWDVILCRTGNGVLPAPAALAVIETEHPPTPVLIVADHADPADVVDLLRHGADCFVEANDLPRLLRQVRRFLNIVREHDHASHRQATYAAHEARYQSIVDQQTDLVCRYDADLRLTFANRAYAKWQGQPAADLIGMDILERILDEEREAVLAHVRSLNAENPSAVSIHQSILGNGNRQIIEWTDSAILDEAGNVVEYQGVGRDVTERETRNEQLAALTNAVAEEHERLTGILNSMQDAVLAVEYPSRRVIYVSSSYQAIYGYPVSRFIEDRDFFQQVVHPDDLEAALAAMNQCLTEGRTEVEHRIIWPDVQVRWLARRAWVDYSPDGQPLRVVDHARDITERKEAEQATHDSEVNLRTLFNSVRDFLLVLDLEGRIITVNQTVRDRLGYPDEALYGQSVLIVHPPDRREEAARFVAEMAAGEREYCPVPLLTQSGELIPVETRVSRCLWDGKPALFGVSKDISVLKLSEEKFSRAFHANPAIVGISRVETGEYVEVNRAFCEKLGFTPDEVIGRKSTELLHLDPQTRQHIIDRLKADGFVRDEEAIIYTKDGRPLTVLLAADIIHMHDTAFMFTTAVDITERKESEAALHDHQRQLQGLIDSQTNYVIRTDLNGNYTYANPKFEREFGWVHGGQSLVGQSGLDSIAPHHHERTRQAVERCLANPGSVVQVEIDKPSQQGGFRSTLWEFVCLTDPQGQPSEVQCMGIEVTNLRRAEQQVTYQAGLLEQVSDAIIATDNAMHITAWNHAATLIYGYTAAEALGQHVDTLLQTEWVTTPQVDAVQTILAEGYWRGRVRQTTQSGDKRHVVAAVSFLRDDQGQIVGGVTVNRDMTETHRAEVLQGHISEILEAIALGQPLPKILEALVYAVEEYTPDMLGSVLLVDPATHTLRHGAAPSLPADYNAAIDSLPIASGVGSCGTAAAEKRLVIVENTQTDPLWQDYRELAARHQLHACWSQPIFGDDDAVVGTVALYYHELRQPKANERELIGLAARLASIAIRRAHAIEALRASEEKYRSLIESADAAISMVDMNGVYLYLNEIAAMPYGVEPEALVGKRVDELFPPDQAQAILFDVRHVISTNRGKVLETHVTLLDKPAWFRTSIQPVRDAEGKPYAAMIYASDVTDKKLAEIALQEAHDLLEERVKERTEELETANNRLEAIFNHSGDAILLFSSMFGIQQANYAFDEMFGVPEDSYVGHPLSDYFLPHEAARLRDNIEQVQAIHQKRVVEMQARRSDGTPFYVGMSIAPVNRSTLPIINLVCIIRDITARKNAEHALRESAARLRDSQYMLQLVLDTIPTRVFWKDRDSVYQGCNLHFALDAGLDSTTDIVGKRDIDLPWLAEHSLAFRAADRAIMESGRARLEFEEQVRVANGTTLIARTSKLPLRNEAGEVIGILGAYDDVTARKAAEAALELTRREQAQMQAYLTALHHITIDLTRAATLEDFYRGVVEHGRQHFGFERMGLLLYDAETQMVRGTYGTDAEGHTVDERHHYFHIDDLTGILRQAMERSERFAYDEDAPLFADFQPIGQGQNAAAALWDGVQLGWLAVDNGVQHQPMTKMQLDILALYALSVGSLMARRQAEQAALALSQRLELATHAGNIGIWEWNLAHDYVVWDERMFAMYGLEPRRGPLPIETFLDRIHPDDLKPNKVPVSASLARDGQYDDTFRIIRPDGAVRYMKANGIVISDAEGVPTHLIGVSWDMTHIKESEEALRVALEKEKEVGELKSRFVSIASHQFRTPLAVIQATTDMLANYRERMDKAQIDARFNKIRAQVTQMKDIMDDVLQLSRVQQGQLEIRPRWEDFRALCREIVEQFDTQDQYRGRLDFSSTPDPIMAGFDTNFMRQVVSNLVHNALKYSEAPKPVLVRLSHTETHITLDIEDEGIGIPSDDLPHLFEPFHRAGNVGTIAGTGLGLSLAKQLVELHRGSLGVKTEVGRGTTFTIVMPRDVPVMSDILDDD